VGGGERSEKLPGKGGFIPFRRERKGDEVTLSVAYSGDISETWGNMGNEERRG